MRLYLVRHAYAGEHGDPRYPDDGMRPLTKKGRRRFAKLIRRLNADEFAPETIGTSPLLRCRQTAETLVENLASPATIEVIEAFAPGCKVEVVVAWAKAIGGRPAAYVGHAPDIDQIAAAFLGAADESLHFAKGAIAVLKFESAIEPGHGSLEWLVTPDIIRRAKRHRRPQSQR